MPYPPYMRVLSFIRASYFVLFQPTFSFKDLLNCTSSLLYETDHPTHPFAKASISAKSLFVEAQVVVTSFVMLIYSFPKSQVFLFLIFYDCSNMLPT